MKRVIRIGLLLAMVAVVLVAGFGFARATQAQTGGGYDLTWNTIDGGGGTSTGGGYTLSGTIGQPDAGPTMTGGSYSLIGGFWSGLQGFLLNLPLIRR